MKGEIKFLEVLFLNPKEVRYVYQAFEKIFVVHGHTVVLPLVVSFCRQETHTQNK